ncbi:MAG: sugar ABC transporter permease [Actinobacteria bacterium RBG_19FT_COMBO_36_27]|nr:MAG: sugar ABC transporter permease [Actinobacteria bacterium RBG_19FT_COMBO_36_27]
MRNFSITKKRVQENLFAYLMLAPDIIGIAIFIFVPILLALYVSLHKWDALSPMEFIGLKNYVTLMSDSKWWNSVIITIIYTSVFVPMVYCTSLLIAVFLNSIPGKKMQGFLRTVYFVPFTVSTIVLAIIWLFMLDPRRGLVNEFLNMFGIPAQSFLGNPDQALFCIAFITGWVLIGYYSILFLAALKDIPVAYYEAAKIDGANVFQLFRSITFPMLKNISAFVLIITTIASFQVFDQVKAMTNGGPAGATNVAVFYIYTNSFDYLKLGYSSALSFVLFVIIFVFSIMLLKITKGIARE